MIGHSSVPEERERVRCCDVMGFLISHLNRYSDWTLEELNTFDICKFQSWGNGNRNRSYLNVKIRRYLDKHKFVTAGGVCWPHPGLPRYVMMIDGCPVAGSRLSLPPPSADLWLSHQHCTFCTTGVTSSVTPLTCGPSDTQSLFGFLLFIRDFGVLCTFFFWRI